MRIAITCASWSGYKRQHVPHRMPEPEQRIMLRRHVVQDETLTTVALSLSRLRFFLASFFEIRCSIGHRWLSVIESVYECIFDQMVAEFFSWVDFIVGELVFLIMIV